MNLLVIWKGRIYVWFTWQPLIRLPYKCHTYVISSCKSSADFALFLSLLTIDLNIFFSSPIVCGTSLQPTSFSSTGTTIPVIEQVTHTNTLPLLSRRFNSTRDHIATKYAYRRLKHTFLCWAQKMRKQSWVYNIDPATNSIMLITTVCISMGGRQ